MARQKYYDFTKIFAEEMEALLLQLKSLISAKKVTDNLPDDTKKEIKTINNKIDNLNIDVDFIDGGEYESISDN